MEPLQALGIALVSGITARFTSSASVRVSGRTTLIKGPCDDDDDRTTSRTVGHGEAWQPQGCQASGCQ
jgi:hypothetical protein